MGILREIVGLALVVIAWFNFFEIELPIRILMFILGFDLMSLALKFGVFVISYFGISFFASLGWTLLLLVVTEVVSSFLLIGLIGKLLIKPTAVFTVAYLALGFQPALILAAIDFFLNLGLGK
jgi:uncharacterized membrane protein